MAMNDGVMTIYLAGPIEGITPEDATGWRDTVADMAPSGCLLFNPVTAWRGVSALTARAVAFGDRVTIANCDGVLAYLSGPGRAFGTIREIEFARSHGKPVVVVSEEPILSCFAHDVFQEVDLDGGLNRIIEAIRKEQDTPMMTVLRLPFMSGPQEEQE